MVVSEVVGNDCPDEVDMSTVWVVESGVDMLV